MIQSEYMKISDEEEKRVQLFVFRNIVVYHFSLKTFANGNLLFRLQKQSAH